MAGGGATGVMEAVVVGETPNTLYEAWLVPLRPHQAPHGTPDPLYLPRLCLVEPVGLPSLPSPPGISHPPHIGAEYY